VLTAKNVIHTVNITHEIYWAIISEGLRKK
jgi:hypothetical protein